MGTRLYPLTSAISKQILPIYDKPMIYYPLSNLVLTGIKEVLIISSPEHINLYKPAVVIKLFGIKLFYKIQKKPKGIAEALILAVIFLPVSSSV